MRAGYAASASALRLRRLRTVLGHLALRAGQPVRAGSAVRGGGGGRDQVGQRLLHHRRRIPESRREPPRARLSGGQQRYLHLGPVPCRHRDQASRVAGVRLPRAGFPRSGNSRGAGARRIRRWIRRAPGACPDWQGRCAGDPHGRAPVARLRRPALGRRLGLVEHVAGLRCRQARDEGRQRQGGRFLRVGGPERSRATDQPVLGGQQHPRYLRRDRGRHPQVHDRALRPLADHSADDERVADARGHGPLHDRDADLGPGLGAVGLQRRLGRAARGPSRSSHRSVGLLRGTGLLARQELGTAPVRRVQFRFRGRRPG